MNTVAAPLRLSTETGRRGGGSIKKINTIIADLCVLRSFPEPEECVILYHTLDSVILYHTVDSVMRT